MPDPNEHGMSIDDGVKLDDGFSTWPSEHGETDSKEIGDNEVQINYRPEDVFHQYDFRNFKDDFLMLNDIVLSDVPTSSITIESNNNVFVAETLRSHSPIVTSSGIHDWTVTITLTFPSGVTQSTKLHRLISQISRHPLVFVFNPRIRSALNILDPTESTMFVVESGTLRNSSDTVGDIILDLTLHYFNHKPFSNHFWFNTRMPGYTPKERVLPERERPTELFSEGYEASAYSIEYEAKELSQSLRNANLQITDQPNVPVNFPSASDAWMYYADHLSTLTPGIPDVTSDFVGFSVKIYSYQSPPNKSQRAGAGVGTDVYNTKFTYPGYSDIYNAMSAPISSDPLKTNSERTAELAVNPVIASGNRPPVTIQRASTGRTIKVQLLDGSNKVITNSLLAFSELCYPKKDPPPRGTLMDPNILVMLQKVVDRYPGRKIIIYSGIRSYSKGKHQHAKARAIDFKVQGIANEDLFTFIATNLKTGGAGYYPNNHPSGGSQFVHMDSRSSRRIVLWVDESGRGQPSRYNKYHEILQKVRNRPPVNINDLKEEAIHLNEERNDRLDEQTSRESPIPGNEQTIDNRPIEDDLVIDRTRDFQARAEWIQKMAELRNSEGEPAGLYYYWDDPKIRNVFYRDIDFYIGSNPEEQKRGDIERDIVFSAISVSFGHRVVPHKLCSQDTYTWQFLGAGNRSGTMVFTFSGIKGRESADRLKAILSAARENARVFGSLIQDVGSVGVDWEKGSSRERNSILALLDIRNIVVTEITESSSPDGADKHQLVINFIVQDFAEEQYDKRLITTSDTKRRIVKGVMDLLWTYKPKDGQWKPKEEKLLGLVDGPEIRDWQIIFPHPKYLSARRVMEPEVIKAEYAHFAKTGSHIGGAGRPYKIKDPSFPSWLAEILINASKYCNEIDDLIPPTGWKISNETSETWKDRYDYWGAGNIIKGRVKNIDKDEMNATSTIESVNKFSESTDATVVIQWDQMYKGNFQYDGRSGSDTNNKHVKAFNKWLNKMNLIVQEVRKHVTDEANFAKYFGTVGEEMINAAISHTGECYTDMFLPSKPNSNLPLPPEFYVYDDSGEDPVLSALTDNNNMASLLEKHIENEVASIERYTKQTVLGGSYISRNLPRIIEERKQYLDAFGGEDRNSGEIGFLSFSGMMREGTQAWEPVFYRPNDTAYNREDVKKWISHISKDIGTGDDAKLNFMDNLIKLSPYLRDGHPGWNTAWNEPKNIVETIYDEDWRDLSFGPNPTFTHVDSIMAGVPSSALSKEALNRARENKIQEEAIQGSGGGEIEGLNRAVTSDAMVTVGNNSFEAFAAIRENLGFEIDQNIKTARGVSETFTLINPITAGHAIAFQGVKSLLSYSDAYEKSQSKRKMEEILKDYDHPISSVFTPGNEKTKLAELTSGIARGSKSKDISIRRAYPTFKIYFIEDDAQETEQVDGQVMRAFDDFYSYSAIQEIRISRSRKVAADMAVIRMTNVAGKLLRKRFGDKPGWESVEKAKTGQGSERATGIFADTEKENPFESMILQDGVKVQIRLGYAASPDNLESVFLGSIVEIQPTEDGKILEIMCQGFGAELEGVELGPLNDGPVFYSSQQVLSGAIIQDSVVNFGRRSKFNRFVPGEGRHSFTGGIGRGLLSSLSPGVLLETWSQQKWYRHLYRYSFRNYPQDDNIFAPPPDVYTHAWERFWDNACTYRPLKQTPWQIFKEHELRHPGYISLAVPYGHSPRMTMFFGAKGQHYWSRPPSALELFLAENASDTIVQMRGMSQQDILSPDFTDKLAALAEKFPKLARAIVDGTTSFGPPDAVSIEISKIFGRYKPFRNYHFFDSSHHILKNQIRTSIDGTYNEVEVMYFEDEEEIESETGISGLLGFGNDGEELYDNIKSLRAGGEGVFSCKLDDNIPEEHIRSYREEFPSCVTDFMAKRYVQGLFARLLRDAYKGDLIVLGEPTLKPYDICYINDASINMTGPIEVESVEHIFNREHGFVSIVTPDLCVDINDMYSASVFDVAGAALAYAWAPAVTAATAAPALAPMMALATPISFLGLMGGVKFMMGMQDGTPVITTPLTLEGKPFMSVALGQHRTNFIMSLHGKWKQYWDDLSVAWDKFDVAETMFDTKLGFQESLYGLFTTDPGDSLPEAE